LLTAVSHAARIEGTLRSKATGKAVAKAEVFLVEL